jgi:transposase
MALRLRSLTDDEAAQVRQLAHSRTAPARTVERARIVWQASQGKRVPAIARELQVCEATVRQWLTRFNEHGLPGLSDLPRAGAPKTYTLEQVSELIAAVLTKPQDLGLPFACWTLDRLAAYLSEHQGISMKRSRIDEILIAEGLRWRQQETWFGERVDPAFAEKRAPSFASTKRHRKRAS